MSQRAIDFSFDDYSEIIKAVAPCMDDYMYFYDVSQDLYYISEKALERFALPTNLFSDVVEMHKVFVYSEDVDMLVEDLQKMVAGEKDEHNIEYRWLSKDGTPIWINCKGRVLKDENNKPKYMIGCVNEIGNRQKADNVSGLKELSSIAESLEMYCSIAASGYVLHIGIDDFKSINERFGHEYGDFILRGVAECIKKSLGPGEEVYRLSADEFMVVSYLADDINCGKTLYEEIRAEVDIFIEQNRYETVFTISGGVLSCAELCGMEFQELVKLSQFALSQAKKHGKNQMYFFDLYDYEDFLRKNMILSAIRESISNNFEGFDVHYQPIMSCTEKPELHGSEALLRYTLPNGERISPMEFIPILEESGLIIPVGKWVLGQAMTFCRRVEEKISKAFNVNVNVSYIQVLKSPFIVEFFRLLNEHGISSSCITIELTESGQVEDSAQMHKVWKNLHQHGVTIALDDFGTGYSNLMNISEVSPNVVKLDRGFTIKALKNEFERNLMQNIIQLVHSLGLKICVEGIETEEELLQIKALDPDYIQGYYYGRPSPADEFLFEFC
ncbi:MAG: GGDEF and EAL domain-containing protein [Agathobacter sp.]|nr:GGDEF and EAL domain-containing protein [Agathobacter sp.]